MKYGLVIILHTILVSEQHFIMSAIDPLSPKSMPDHTNVILLPNSQKEGCRTRHYGTVRVYGRDVKEDGNRKFAKTRVHINYISRKCWHFLVKFYSSTTLRKLAKVCCWETACDANATTIYGEAPTVDKKRKVKKLTLKSNLIFIIDTLHAT